MIDLEKVRQRVEAREMAGGLAAPKSQEVADARALLDAVDAARALLDQAEEWMQDNPPSDGWGILDRAADAERDALLIAIRAMVRP